MQQDQLSRSNSIVNQMQRALLHYKNNPTHSGEKNNQKQKGAARIFIVPEVATVLRTIVSVMDSIKPEKRELKRNFFAKEASENFLPDAHTNLPLSKDAVARHVTGAFRKWADKSEIPLCDANILLSVLGSLGKIISADRSVLDAIPVNESTKDILTDFFGSSCESSSNSLKEKNDNFGADFIGNNGQGTLTQNNRQEIAKHDALNNSAYALQQFQPRDQYAFDRGSLNDLQYVSTSIHSMATANILPPPPFSMNVQHQTLNYTPMQAPGYRPGITAQGHTQAFTNYLQTNEAFPATGIHKNSINHHISQQNTLLSQPLADAASPYILPNRAGDMRRGVIQNQTYREEVSYPSAMSFQTQRSQRQVGRDLTYTYGQHNLSQDQDHSQTQFYM